MLDLLQYFRVQTLLNSIFSNFNLRESLLLEFSRIRLVPYHERTIIIIIIIILKRLNIGSSSILWRISSSNFTNLYFLKFLKLPPPSTSIQRNEIFESAKGEREVDLINSSR